MKLRKTAGEGEMKLAQIKDGGVEDYGWQSPSPPGPRPSSSSDSVVVKLDLMPTMVDLVAGELKAGAGVAERQRWGWENT
jgi:hypothetical protein